MLSYVEAKPFDLIEDLINDTNKAFEYLEADKENQYLRRSAVKAVFSFIECIPYILKYKLRSDICLERYEYKLNEKEKELLYEFDRDKYTLLDNFKKTFKLTKKVWELDNLDLKTDSKEYQILRKSILVRNRITHPKRHSDIIISDEDIYNALVSFEYIRNNFSNIMSKQN